MTAGEIALGLHKFLGETQKDLTQEERKKIEDFIKFLSQLVFK